MISNIFRVFGFIGVIISAFYGLHPVWMAICGLFGEGIGTFASVFRLKLKHKIPLSYDLFPGLVIMGFLTVAFFMNKNFDFPAPMVHSFSGIIIGSVLMAVSFYVLYPALRKEVFNLRRE